MLPKNKCGGGQGGGGGDIPLRFHVKGMLFSISFPARSLSLSIVTNAPK